MKRTWVLRSLVGEVGEVMATAPSLAAAAARLGVDRSSVCRWVKAGRIPPPAGRQRRRPPADSVTAATGLTDTPVPPAGWAAAVRAAYELNASEAELVRLAETALALAHDAAQPAAVRIQAMRAFSALLRQLDLEVDDGEVTTAHAPARAWPRLA
jgi:hypothetical protein